MADLPYRMLQEVGRVLKAHGAHVKLTASRSELLKQLSHILQDLPPHLWVEPDVDPQNHYLQQLSLRQPWQARSVSEALRHDILRPLLVEPHGGDPLHHTLEADDIRAVLRFHLRRSHRVSFLGVFPPGSQVLWPAVDTLRRKCAVVVNTSDHGSHWVAAWFDRYKACVEFFDPLGHPPGHAVAAFLQRLRVHLNNTVWLEPTLVPVQHQRGIVQCGMYCVWFVLAKARFGLRWEDLQADPLTDAQMAKLRIRLFRLPDAVLQRLMAERRRKFACDYRK